MPKIVDHALRRQQVVDALWRIIDRDGIGAVSIRALAREAGVPRATAAYYFDGRADLLFTAMQTSMQRSLDRVKQFNFDEGGVEPFIKAFWEAVPLTAKRRKQTGVWLALVSEAQHDNEVMSLLASTDAEFREYVIHFLEMMDDRGLLKSDVDITLIADELHALIDGLALHTMTDPKAVPPNRLKAVLVDWANRVTVDQSR